MYVVGTPRGVRSLRYRSERCVRILGRKLNFQSAHTGCQDAGGRRTVSGSPLLCWPHQPQFIANVKWQEHESGRPLNNVGLSVGSWEMQRDTDAMMRSFRNNICGRRNGWQRRGWHITPTLDPPVFYMLTSISAQATEQKGKKVIFISFQIFVKLDRLHSVDNEKWLIKEGRTGFNVLYDVASCLSLLHFRQKCIIDTMNYN